jgi:hypothetical protein
MLSTFLNFGTEKILVFPPVLVYGGYGMKSAQLAMVLVAILAMGSLGGTVFLGVAQPHSIGCGIGLNSDFNGGTPPSNLNAVPGDDPEHPK